MMGDRKNITHEQMIKREPITEAQRVVGRRFQYQNINSLYSTQNLLMLRRDIPRKSVSKKVKIQDATRSECIKSPTTHF